MKKHIILNVQGHGSPKMQIALAFWIARAASPAHTPSLKHIGTGGSLDRIQSDGCSWSSNRSSSWSSKWSRNWRSEGAEGHGEGKDGDESAFEHYDGLWGGDEQGIVQLKMR